MPTVEMKFSKEMLEALKELEVLSPTPGTDVEQIFSHAVVESMRSYITEALEDSINSTNALEKWIKFQRATRGVPGYGFIKETTGDEIGLISGFIAPDDLTLNEPAEDDSYYYLTKSPSEKSLVDEIIAKRYSRDEIAELDTIDKRCQAVADTIRFETERLL